MRGINLRAFAGDLVSGSPEDPSSLSETVMRYSSPGPSPAASHRRPPLTEPREAPDDICIVVRDKWDLAEKARVKNSGPALFSSLQETVYS